MAHITVLKEEAVNSLTLNSNSVVVDCTLGAGGHAAEIIKHLDKSGVYVGIDADITAIDSLESLKKSACTVHLVHSNFSQLTEVLEKLELKPDAILADLGWRSEQFEDVAKGFSFNKDEPLIMTYGNPESHVFTAGDIVNDWAEESIADVIYGYGGEQFSRRIAKAISIARKEADITTAKQLAGIVEDAVPGFYRKGRIHPATKTFQALRIAVNDELGVLRTLLQDGFDSLASDGKMAIITFHSLEDKIVKEFFREIARDEKGVRITKKPIIATDEELKSNPRARSAKLRVVQKF